MQKSFFLPEGDKIGCWSLDSKEGEVGYVVGVYSAGGAECGGSCPRVPLARLSNQTEDNELYGENEASGSNVEARQI